MADSLPVAVFTQAVEYGRAGDPDHFIMCGRAGKQVFRINRLLPFHSPTHCQRECEAEREAVKVLRNHAADHGFTVLSKWQCICQSQGFGLHLRGGFYNNLRFAAGARRFQPCFGMVGNQMVFRGGGRVFRRCVCRQIGQVPHGWADFHIQLLSGFIALFGLAAQLALQIFGIRQKHIRRPPPVQIVPSQIRQQQHPPARMPHCQHGTGKQRGIVKPQHGRLHFCLFQTA